MSLIVQQIGEIWPLCAYSVMAVYLWISGESPN